MHDTRSTQRIGFLLLPKFSMLALVCALEPLRVANRFAGPLYSWHLVSDDGRPVTASNSVPMVVEGRLSEARDLSMLIVCASYDPEAAVTAAMLSQLRQLSRFGTALGSLDSGCFVLARAGLLDGYRVTLHWESVPAFAERFPKVETSMGLFEIDRDRLTSPGATASLDMMLHLIRTRHGEELAMAVTDQIVYQRVRGPAASQRLAVGDRLRVTDPVVIRAVETMEDAIEEPLSAAALADAAGTTERQLERLFRRHLDTTPKRFYLNLRLERARQLLVDTDMRVVEVAVACGFGSAAHFARAYKARYGKPPTSHRPRAVPPPLIPIGESGL
ncbi:MAG TPA: GlxA family transcriptional regulator [Alphaproteobacteria bacterium]|nr:GlxA family transcriptional regulator [Alphaproteobacteria bacterium]